MTVDRDGHVRCKCGEIADVFCSGRWTCIDRLTPEPHDMSGPPGHNEDR